MRHLLCVLGVLVSLLPAPAPGSEVRDGLLQGALAGGIVGAPAPHEESEQDPPDPERAAFEEALFGGEEEPEERDEREALEDELFGGGGDARDEAIFGGGDEEEEETRDDAMLGGPSSLSEEIFGKLDQLEDPLALGGQLFMRLQYDFSEGDDLETSRVSSPNLLDIYLDARPNDRIRAFFRGRLTHDFSIAPSSGEEDTASPFGQREESAVALDQLWIKFDIAKDVFFTIGRQPIRWGTGRFWNPTDVLNQQFRDPLASLIFDARLGVSLIKMHIPVQATFETDEGLDTLDMNFYVIANIEDAGSLADIGGALRAEFVYDIAEWALTVAARKDTPLRLAADVSAAVWDFDVKMELAVSRFDTFRSWEGEFDVEGLVFPTEKVEEDLWVPQVVVGTEIAIKYSDEDNVVIGAEYFYNHRGYEDAGLLPWLIFNGDYQPLYTGKHYVAAYVALLSPGSWNDTSFFLSGLGNVSGRLNGAWAPSFLTRLDYRVNVLTYLSLNAFATVFLGEGGTEFRPSIEVPPLPGIEGLENGLSFPPQWFQLGVGAIVRI